VSYYVDLKKKKRIHFIPRYSRLELSNG